MVSVFFRKRWVKVPMIAAMVVGCWMLFVYAADLLIYERNDGCCAVCGRQYTVYERFLIPVRRESRDSEFSRFYRTHADSEHRHVWIGCGIVRERRSGEITGHGTWPRMLRYPVALAVLRSLPDEVSRKAFFERHYDFVCGNSMLDQAGTLHYAKAIDRLNAAYEQDESRKDWLELVKKVGLYPKAVKGH